MKVFAKVAALICSFSYLFSQDAQNTVNLDEINYLTKVYKSANKSWSFLQDGRSFEKFEKDFREKYKNLNIPKILFSSEDEGLCYFTYYKTIGVFHENIKNRNTASLEWGLLHETGHHNEPNFLFEWKLIPCLLFLYYNRQAINQVVNRITLTDKLINRAEDSLSWGLLLTFLGEHFKQRPFEYYADNFANKHGSKEALVGAYYYFKQAESEKIKAYNKREESIFFYPINFFLDYFFADGLSHPSYISRTNTIAKYLKNRFEVDVNDVELSKPSYLTIFNNFVLSNPKALICAAASIATLGYGTYALYNQNSREEAKGISEEPLPEKAQES